MSHFTVLVIGKDPERQLAPYHEFECTGVDDEYVQSVDRTQQVLDLLNDKRQEDPGYTLDEALDYFGFKPVEDESRIDISDEHKYGYAVVKNGELIKAVKRTNPNAQWDWYVLGGRWRGFFKLKPNSEGFLGEAGVFDNEAKYNADAALKGDIDFAGMRAQEGNEAVEDYRAFYKALGDREMPPRWETVRQQYENIEDARRAYHEHPSVVAVKEFQHWYIDIVDIYGCTEEEFRRRAEARSCVPYAVVKDGQWYQKSSMGWWGLSTNEMTQDEWNEQVWKFINEASDDTLFSLFDCHI